jgi:hypothetical protein
MSAPYVSQAISNYNTSPPPDDGSTGADNEVDWSFIKTKIGDPIKVLSEAINTAAVSGFAKVLGGVGVTSTATTYTVLSSDQGKLVRASAGGITVTTPDATDVLSPFVFAFLNNSSGTLTFAGNGAQTVDGNASVEVPAGTGFVVFTDGSNWYTTGRQGTLTGAQLTYGNIINGTIVESNATNAVTFALKTLAGNDPSATDPVLICFRSATATSGIYVYRTVTAALSLTISAGSTLGTVSTVPCKLWIVIFDDAGTLRIGAINCRSGNNIYPLGRTPLASSTTEGGAGGADTAQVFYTDTGVTTKPYVILAYASYESGISTAGNWNVSPDYLQLFGLGNQLPGDTIQRQGNSTGALATGTTVFPVDDSIPQITEGDEYLSQAISATSSSNLLEIESSVFVAVSAGGGSAYGAALFVAGTNDALDAALNLNNNNNQDTNLQIKYIGIASVTTSQTFSIRSGPNTAATMTFNGVNGARLMGGVMNSFIRVKEIVA